MARTAVRPSVEQLDLLSATRTDLAAIRREIQPLARRLAARLAIEQRHGRRGPLDFRRTIRASLSFGGIPMETRHRPRRPHKTDLVVLCDVSESVASFAHFTLLLVYALREQFSRVRVFAFIDELDEVTAFFRPGARRRRVARAGWPPRRRCAGGTAAPTTDGRSGCSASAISTRCPRARHCWCSATRARTTATPALPALRDIVGRARRAYWLNPERRSAWDTGDSIAADYGRVVPMVECRNLAQLASFVRELV